MFAFTFFGFLHTTEVRQIIPVANESLNFFETNRRQIACKPGDHFGWIKSVIPLLFVFRASILSSMVNSTAH